MRFMMLVIPKGHDTAPPGTLPDAKLVETMSKYIESLANAGVLLSLDGLHPPSIGARVRFAGGKPTPGKISLLFPRARSRVRRPSPGSRP